MGQGVCTSTQSSGLSERASVNVSDFIAAFRSEMADGAAPFLWSDEEVVSYLNDAVQEACERAFLIEDSATPAVCTIALQQGVDTYPLHPSVLQIKRLVCSGRVLQEVSIEALDESGGGWDTRQGQPQAFIFEQATGLLPPSLRLVPAPAQAGGMALTVYRGAIAPLDADRDSEKPEVPERFHARLKGWVYRCAYLKQDAETLDKSKAREHEAGFEASFGPRQDANVQRKQRDRKPPLVRCAW